MFSDVFGASSEDVLVKEEPEEAWSSHEGEEPGGKEPENEAIPEEKKDVKSNVQKQIKMMCATICKGAQARKGTGATGKGPLKAIHTHTHKEKR